MSFLRYLLLVLVFAWLVSRAVAGVQIMSPDKLALYRAGLPKIADPLIDAMLSDSDMLWYTEAEMPPAYQHDLGASGVCAFFWARHNISGDDGERQKGNDRGGNANIEFPWRQPGGTDAAEHSTASYRGMLLPKRSDGQAWPVVIWQERTIGPREGWRYDGQPFYGAHLAYKWLYPLGTTFVEVLTISDSAGRYYPYEIRTRVRQLEEWDVDVLRPAPTLAELERLVGRKLPRLGQLTTTQTLRDTLHRRSGFDAQAASYTLPRLSETEVLTVLSAPFQSANGKVFASDGTNHAFAPTAQQAFSIVPAGYRGTFLGTDNESCKKCHESTLKHVHEFDDIRQWYGRVRGSADGIFSFHPIDPSSVSADGMTRPVNLRPAFVQAGIVEWFDERRHPGSIYTLLPGKSP